MSRESADEKGRRYLVEGRVALRFVDADRVAATVRGDGTEHRVRFTRARGWTCSCPAVGRCSHLVAVRCVTAVLHEDRAQR